MKQISFKEWHISRFRQMEEWLFEDEMMPIRWDETVSGLHILQSITFGSLEIEFDLELDQEMRIEL